MKVEARVYKGTKYEDKNEPIKVQYDIKDFKVVGGDEAERIEAMTDGSGIDENHEYLVLFLMNGETATFRNSHVDLHEAR